MRPLPCPDSRQHLFIVRHSLLSVRRKVSRDQVHQCDRHEQGHRSFPICFTELKMEVAVVVLCGQRAHISPAQATGHR
ncbi:hypothetical protein Mapa_011393 [Marchantia paleacea]|nr:hypothetical protein Mapa_011393 [Marchantia paleacea]